mgnify:FL=1
MENILLRKLSRKSVITGLPFGYLENQLVSNVLSISPRSLVKIYYHYEKISFTDDILDELGIVGDLVISKPCIDAYMFTEYKKRAFRNLDENTRMGKSNRYRAQMKKKSTFQIFNNSADNKNKFRLINQGHSKK